MLVSTLHEIAKPSKVLRIRIAIVNRQLPGRPVLVGLGHDNASRTRILDAILAALKPCRILGNNCFGLFPRRPIEAVIESYKADGTQPLKIPTVMVTQTKTGPRSVCLQIAAKKRWLARLMLQH